MPTVSLKVSDEEFAAWKVMASEDEKGMSACIRDTMNARARLTPKEREEMPAVVKAKERVEAIIKKRPDTMGVLCDRCYRLGSACCAACRAAVEKSGPGIAEVFCVGDTGPVGGLPVCKEEADRAVELPEAGVGGTVAEGALPGRPEGVLEGMDQAGIGLPSGGGEVPGADDCPF